MLRTDWFDSCAKKTLTVKHHSIEKPILLNFVNFLTKFCPKS